jgi:hypothetical protein
MILYTQNMGPPKPLQMNYVHPPTCFGLHKVIEVVTYNLGGGGFDGKGSFLLIKSILPMHFSLQIWWPIIKGKEVMYSCLFE